MSRKLFGLFLVAASSLAVGAAGAKDGDLVPAFYNDPEFPGYGFYPTGFGTSPDESLATVVPLTDGRMYVVGTVRTGQTTFRASVVRIESTGVRDDSFGPAGTRTYNLPCAAARVSDAAVDSQQRLWFAVRGCGDFLLYRLKANGNPDLDLLGTGLLTVAFDLGGSASDIVRRIAITPGDGILAAGTAASNMPSSTLAVAHFTTDGQPVPGLGINGDGKATLPMSVSISGVTGLHLAEGGEIVITGYRTGNGGSHQNIVARLLSSGAPNAEFGNLGPGYSHIDFEALNNWFPTSAGSLLQRDGSVLQLGTLERDFYIAKWRADGFPDLAFGQHSLRKFPLDFGGPDVMNPDDNDDVGRQIVRQGDGKLLMVGHSRGPDGLMGISLLRLNRDFTPDATFGEGGKIRHVLPIQPQYGEAVSLSVLG